MFFRRWPWFGAKPWIRVEEKVVSVLMEERSLGLRLPANELAQRLESLGTRLVRLEAERKAGNWLDLSTGHRSAESQERLVPRQLEDDLRLGAESRRFRRKQENARLREIQCRQEDLPQGVLVGRLDPRANTLCARSTGSVSELARAHSFPGTIHQRPPFCSQMSSRSIEVFQK